MNDVKAYFLVVLTCLAYGSSAAVAAATKLADSSFQDWSGSVEHTSLADGSMLSEYTAKTPSVVDEAMLALSFVPRFSCTPMISLRLPDAMFTADANPVLEMSIDDVRQSFNGYLDDDGDFLRFSLAANTKELITIRQQIDAASRVVVRVLPASPADEDVSVNNDTDPDASNGLSADQNEAALTGKSVEFSLRGSQLAANAVEKHCKMHQSAAYVPK